MEVFGAERELYVYTYGTHVIWGATARILRDFLQHVTQVPGMAATLGLQN
jgi:uncharacterized Rmd1/YagE family protein